MRLRTAFISANYLLAALALSCLVLSEMAAPWTGTLFLLGLAACFYFERKKVLPQRPTLRIWGSKWNLLGFLPLYLFLDISLLDLIVWSLVFLLFTRIVFKTELNDYLFGYLVAIVCLLLGAMYIQDLVFGFVFLAFYLILCWCLIFYNLMVERSGSHSAPETFKSTGDEERAGGALFALSGGMVFLSLIMTLTIFISFPRLGLGWFGLNDQIQPLSGFSDSVTLGDVGKIKENPSVVMRVEYARNGKIYHPKSRILWRGVALDHYDGNSWSATVDVNWKANNKPGKGTKIFRTQSRKEVVQQNVFMESFYSNIIFTHGIPLFVDGNFKNISMDESFAFRVPGAVWTRKKLTLLSDIGDPDRSFPWATLQSETNVFPSRFLQLPTMSPRIVQLARDLTRDAATGREKAGRILNHLGDGFGYTLEMEETPHGQALDHFLFKRKKGHCEFFASAMVMLLRLAGIPARMVNGFVGEEWNEMGDYLIVRQKHAHSWVEAFIPGSGWVVYDPTPGNLSPAGSNSLTALEQTLDLLRLNWQRYVIRYSVRDQMEIMSFFGAHSREMTKNFKIFGSESWNNAVNFLRSKFWIPVLLGGAIVVAFLLRSRMSWRGFALASRQPFTILLYREMLKRLKKYGVQKEDHWTHREFLRHLSALPEEKRGLAETITRFYELGRFGQMPASDSEKNELWNAVRQM